MTKRTTWACGLAAWAAAAGAAPARADVADAVPPHLADARTMVAGIRPADNRYTYGNGSLTWKGEDGAVAFVNHADCSAFVTLLLEHSYHFTAKQVRQTTGSEHPHADVWHDAIRAGRGGLHEVTRLADARPGDILAVKFPPHTGDTGHVMLVDAPPVPHAASAPVEAGTTQWDLTIIDSTKSPHGPADTRRHPDGTAGTGVGRGTVRVYTAADGTVAGYAWSDSDQSEYRPQAERNLAIGRLDPATVP